MARTKKASTYSDPSRIEEFLRLRLDFASFQLNGGAAILSKMLKEHLAKSGKTGTATCAAIKFATSAFYKLLHGKATGISLRGIRKLSKLFKMAPLKLADTILRRNGETSLLPVKAEAAELIPEQLTAEQALQMLTGSPMKLATAPSTVLTVNGTQVVVELFSKDANPVVVELLDSRIVVRPSP